MTLIFFLGAQFGEDIVSSEQNSLNENSGPEKSPEESVLEELGMVMAQVKLLSTRKLFLSILLLVNTIILLINVSPFHFK